MKLVHVLQHTSAEYLGLIEDHLEGRNIRFRYCRPFAGKNPFPRPEALQQGLIVLGGGPWGSAGGRDVPTLAEEVLLVQTCLERQLPVIGIGLGAQILALASGGRAESSPLVFQVSRAKRITDQALGGYLPAEFPLACYMRDRAVPPGDAQILAVDEQERPVLWQAGARALGFAGHPGFKVAMVEDLVMEFEEGPGEVAAGLADLRLVQRAMEDALVPMMTGIVQMMDWMGAPA